VARHRLVLREESVFAANMATRAKRQTLVKTGIDGGGLAFKRLTPKRSSHVRLLCRIGGGPKEDMTGDPFGVESLLKNSDCWARVAKLVPTGIKKNKR